MMNLLRNSSSFSLTGWTFLGEAFLCFFLKNRKIAKHLGTICPESLGRATGCCPGEGGGCQRLCVAEAGATQLQGDPRPTEKQGPAGRAVRPWEWRSWVSGGAQMRRLRAPPSARKCFHVASDQLPPGRVLTSLHLTTAAWRRFRVCSPSTSVIRQQRQLVPPHGPHVHKKEDLKLEDCGRGCQAKVSPSTHPKAQVAHPSIREDSYRTRSRDSDHGHMEMSRY